MNPAIPDGRHLQWLVAHLSGWSGRRSLLEVIFQGPAVFTVECMIGREMNDRFLPGMSGAIRPG
jgi:hypothetical protein